MAAELLEMLVCIMGFLLHWYVYKPCDKYQCSKASFRKQEAPQLELITTSVYPVGLGKIWQVHVGKSG